jgi:hypothetical protein
MSIIRSPAGPTLLLRHFRRRLPIDGDRGMVYEPTGGRSGQSTAPGREPIVMDFGLVRRKISDESRLTMTSAMRGTPVYITAK